jgi:Putative zinc-finger
MRCEEVRDLAPELALGIADGEQRAEALRHLSGCPDCRRAVERLSQVADELLMVAPVQEPAAGFESRVVEAMGLPEPSPRRRLPRWLTPRRLLTRLGPVVATAAATAVILVAVYHDDHQTAQRYRETLAEANGRYFQAEPLRDETGARAGVAFGYEGSPSWVLVTVDTGHRYPVRRAELRTKDGRTIPIRSLRLRPDGSWGGAIPVGLYRVASIRLLGSRPGEYLGATFPQGAGESD